MSYRIAIAGFGPRGLGALEALLKQLHGQAADLSIDIFEPGPAPGAGPNYDPDQSPLCPLNLPLRGLWLPRAEHCGSAFRDFAECLPEDERDPDAFLPRARIGAYFADRFAHLRAHLPGNFRLSLHDHRVTRLMPADGGAGGWMAAAAGAEFGPYDEVLLTLGQPESEADGQLARWQAHARETGAALLSAYPASRLLAAAESWQGKVVAVRGLGLSAFDVLRMLTQGLGGRFTEQGYLRSGREPARICPFSLDGQPPAPKPATAAVDDLFRPLAEETRVFEQNLEKALSLAPGPALDLICEALQAPLERILAGRSTPAEIRGWLCDGQDTPAGRGSAPVAEFLEDTIAMARGDTPPSPGYAAAQLWQNWLESFREVFAASDPERETAKAVAGFDGRLMPYAYGPPVSAAEELLALIRAGIADLRAVEDPDVRLVPHGWQLAEGADEITAEVMVDAVLAAPAIARTREPLLQELLAAGLLHPVDEGLGAATGEGGQALSRAGEPVAGLSVLGRMAKGSAVAVDSLHDCFGATAVNWAEGAARRITAG
ncbi:FAD/NAD(P)-binding protein [Cribrihabitans neustonicus]|uniref:FAD/NAD(P)-binding protein n=1 Tax=Cribrihabitans neustonicus TaxID=1429085 RepID=UPI003B5A20AA